MNLQPKDFSSEFTFKTSRSSGKGGQHVNKVESRVSLFFNVMTSSILSDEQKELIINSKIVTLNKEHTLQIDAEESRSQRKNKLACVAKFHELISKALQKPKTRKATRPSKAAIKKRLKDKKNLSEKKKNRQKDF